MGTVVGKTTDPQRYFSRGNFNLRESLNRKNIASDLICVEVLIQANIANDGISNADGNRASHPDDPQKTVGGNPASQRKNTDYKTDSLEP